MAKLICVLLWLALHQGAQSWAPSSRLQKHRCNAVGGTKATTKTKPRTSTVFLNAGGVALPAPEGDSMSSSIGTTSTSIPSVSPVPPKQQGDSPMVLLSTKEQIKQQARKEGGPFTFMTKYGALNPYAIYYGFTSIFLGLFWFVALKTLELFYFITRNRIDPQRRFVITASQIWGESLMFLVRARPKFVGKDKLSEFFKTKQAAMFVANHNSWLDIPFLGGTIGWRNYKIVSKAELGKVPILGKAIKLGKHIMVDRSDRKSQIATLRQGMGFLKDGIHLCTFPEGTRTKNGRLLPFKNGAFKMAHKVGAPIVPLSIVGSGDAMPYYWMFPYRPARGFAKVIIHEPISSDDKTEDELVQQVRKAIIDGLPEKQRPLES